MYSEYKQNKQFFKSAEDLLKTSKTMQDIFLMATHLHKKDKALTWINEKEKVKTLKYRQYRSACFEYASRLSQMLKNLEPDAVVALKLKNCPEWPLLFWAILMCGFVPFLIDAKLPKENTEILLKESKAEAIVTQEIAIYSVVSVNLTALNDVKVNFKFASKWANQIIFCSSGTTGNVKLMIYDGANMCHQIAAAIDMPEQTRDIMYPGEINIIAMIPFHHIFGFVAVFLWYTFFGKNIVFTKDLSPKEICGVSQKCGVTHVYSVPLFWDSLAQMVIRKAELEGPKKSDLLSRMIAFHTQKISNDEAGSAAGNMALNYVQNQLLGKKIKYCISGGGFLSIETLNTINGIGYPLCDGYGMTEAGVTSVELSYKVEQRLKGSIGRPLHGIQYKLVNTTTMDPNTGELMIKSPIIHTLEIVNGEKQKPVLEDGYFRTGDIAYVDETGNYYLKGRIKDIIINENGENIFPDEIEDYFKDIKGVSKTCVVGIKKGNNNHEVITCILEINVGVTEEQLEDIKKETNEINNTLSNEKRVQEFLISKNKLPLTASMKVKRFKVKELLEKHSSLFVGINEKKEVKTFEGFKKEEVEPIVKQMREIFAQVLLLPIVKIGDDDHWINDLGGDSMSYVELVGAINNGFQVEIPEDKYAILTNVNDFAEEVLILRQK
jgi:acyl carrier protein